MTMALFNLTNFNDHPEDPNWVVFQFTDATMLREFTDDLTNAAITYEQDTGGPPFLVGVKQRNREAAVRINYRVLGRHRSPFMADKALRWTVIGVVAVAIALAVAGALING